MRHHDLLIIGTGSGNTIVDCRFADLDVAIVEEGLFGGTCLNVGCIPTKMFVHTADLASGTRGSSRFGIDAHVDRVRWADIRDRIFGRIDPIAAAGEAYRRQSPNVTVYAARGRFVGPRTLHLADGTEISAERIVIAAGSRAVVPEVPGLDGSPRPADGIHTSDTVMRIDDVPESMVILGGGVIAAEMAHVFSALGAHVTIVHRGPRLLRTEDADVSARFTEVAEQKWDVRLSTVVSRVESTGGRHAVHLAPIGEVTGAGVVETDLILVATGRVPNSDRLDVAATGVTTHPDGRVVVDERQQTVVPGIYALGDVSSEHQLKHVANAEARTVQHNLLHPEDPVDTDHRFIPHAVFSSPQVASAGETEQQLRDRGAAYTVGVQRYADIAYGWAMEDTTGLAKVLGDPATDRLLGAHIIGPQASTVIQPLLQAMSLGLPASRLARGQYWIHPAMPEVVENALLNLAAPRR